MYICKYIYTYDMLLATGRRVWAWELDPPKGHACWVCPPRDRVANLTPA